VTSETKKIEREDAVNVKLRKAQHKNEHNFMLKKFLVKPLLQV